jgi:hypothetical protein
MPYKDPEVMKNYMKEYREKNKEKLAQQHRENWVRNRTTRDTSEYRKMRCKRSKANAERSRNTLDDNYIKSKVIGRSKVLKVCDIPQELIEVKRLQVMIKRELQR